MHGTCLNRSNPPLQLQPARYKVVQVLRARMGAEAKRFDLPESAGGPLDMQASTGLLSLAWSRELVQSPGTVPVLTAGALVSSDSELPPDHLVMLQSQWRC